MAISFVGGSYNRDGNGPNISTDLSNMDSGTIASGDVAILTVMKDQDDGSAHNQTAGATFTQVHFDESTAGRDRSVSLWYRVLDGTETTVTFADVGDTGEETSVLVSVYRGVGATVFDTPFVPADHYTEAQNNYNGTPDPITTVTNGAWVVIAQCITHDDVTTAGAPSGYTIAVDGTGTSNDHAQQIHVYKEIATAGTETPGAMTHTVNNNVAEANFFTLALRPGSSVNITDAGTDEDFRDGESVVFTGSGFEAAQGTGKLELWDDTSGTTKTEATITAWSDTSITATVALGSIAPGNIYAVVTNDSAEESNKFAVLVRRAVMVELVDSTHVTAGGEDITTARLTGHTGSLTTGRVWDDENGTDSIDIGDGNHTELAWIVQGTTDADTVQVEFRVVKADGTPLDTVTATPQAAFSAAAPAIDDVARLLLFHVLGIDPLVAGPMAGSPAGSPNPALIGTVFGSSFLA